MYAIGFGGQGDARRIIDDEGRTVVAAEFSNARGFLDSGRFR